LQEKIKNWRHENDSENTISGHRLVIFNRMPRASPSTFLTLLFPRNMLRMEIHRLFAFMKVIVWHSLHYGLDLNCLAQPPLSTAQLLATSHLLCDEGPLSLWQTLFFSKAQKN
jgi:hypothetical protein